MTFKETGQQDKYHSLSLRTCVAKHSNYYLSDMKKCPECGNQIKGRSDKIFCSTKCRLDHNNGNRVSFNLSQEIDRDTAKAHMGQIIVNCKIIQKALDNGKNCVSINDLYMAGFDPEYFTRRTFDNNKNIRYFFNYFMFRYGQSDAVEIGKL